MNAETYRLRQKIEDGLLWWEEASLIEGYHRQMQAEYGSRRTGRPRKEEGRVGWGIRDTARALRIPLGNVAESLQLARALRFDSALRNIGTKRDAIEVVRIAAKLSKGKR